MNKTDQALQRSKQGCSCSQAVLAPFAKEMGLTDELALRIASGFGGGMGRSGSVCGAVSGAIMVLGLQHGNAVDDDKASKEKAYEKVRDFLNRFRAKHGATLCPELLGCDIGTPEGMQKAKDQQLFTTRCRDFVQSAVVILEEMQAGR